MTLKRFPVMYFSLLIFFFSTFLFIETSFAQGDQRPKISLNTTAEKEIVSGTAENKIITTVPAKDTISGDVIKYTIHYKNEGDTEAKDAFVVDPIPAGSCYIDGTASAGDAELSFSLDSGNTFLPPPVMIKRKDADGKTEEIPAPPQSFTHIKWTFLKGLKPAQNGTLSFKVKVL
jgi:uncharacterized repeat protein (TIGR01451 family)